MRIRQSVNRRVLVLGLLVALLTSLGLTSAATSAHAATKYTLTAAGAGTTTTNQARKLTVTFKKNGKAVKKATVLLQYLKADGSWATEKKVTVKKGKGAVKVKHSVMSRTYRFYVKGKGTSKSFTVHFVPASFTIKGSGAGHGVGMSQYGAYELAREGKSAAQILTTYYSGAVVDSMVVNNPRTVKVQVLGPPADARKTTTLSINSGGFTITGAGAAVSTKAKKPVSIAVSGSKVTAKVTLPSGKSKTLSGTRLTFTWGSSATATVAGAQGSYRYGNLQVTVLQKRPNVVNELKMNTEYLYGIDEMPSSWGSAAAEGMEALRAQAIASRSYVITLASRANEKWGNGKANPACDCQVFDDTRNQNFTGWKKSAGDSSGYWRKAVDSTATATTVTAVRPSATSRGEFAETTFFARTGTVPGFTPATSRNADAFVGVQEQPYLVGVLDPHSAKAPGSNYLSWTTTLKQADAKKLFGSYVKKIEVSTRFSGGLLRQVKVTFANGKTGIIEKRATVWMSGLKVPSAWVTSISGR